MELSRLYLGLKKAEALYRERGRMWSSWHED